MSKFTDVIDAPWEYKTEPFKVIGDIYYVGDKHVSVYLLDTQEGLILLDTALPQTLYQLWDAIYVLGFNPRDIKHIFHTHAHYDHIGGTRALKEVSGAITYLGSEDVELMERRQDLIAHECYGCKFHEYFSTDIALTGDEVFDFGNISIECVHTPGHTPGTMTYFLKFKHEGKELVASLFGGFGTNTLAGEYLKKFNLDDEMQYAYKKSVELLMNREVDILLGSHPMHNDTFEKAANSTSDNNLFINPLEWPFFLTGRIQAINEILGC